MSNRNWNDNELQFARLIHEIDATQLVDWGEIAEQMDLYQSEVRELVERANEVFTGTTRSGTKQNEHTNI